MASSIKTQPQAALISSKIHLLREHRVMLDADLAELYQVATKVLVQAVKRNFTRFPEDFMFQLSAQEFANLRSQIVTSSWGGRRTAPYAFTEQGVAMLSSVLSSPQAIAINVEIMRTFVMVRQLAATHQDLAKRLNELEAKTEHHALKLDAFANITRKQLKEVFEALRQLTTPPDPPKRPIGFGIPEISNKPKVRSARK
jgi:ORF6N domain